MKVKVDHPQINRDLNQGILHLWSKLGAPSLTGDQLSGGQARNWRTDTQTQSDAGNNNTRRPKLASGKNLRTKFYWTFFCFPWYKWKWSRNKANLRDFRGPARPLTKYRNLYRKNFGKIQDFTGYNLEKKRKNKGIIKQLISFFILDVYRLDTVHLSWQTAALTVWAISISKWGITRYLFSVDRSITGQRSPFFFGTRNSLLKNPRKRLLWTGSMAPFSSRLSTAFCRSCFLLLVGKWMGVLVKGDWWHSHFNRTPNRRILDNLHSPSRFCHC